VATTLANLLVKVDVDTRGVQGGFSKLKAAAGIAALGVAALGVKMGIDFVQAAEETRRVSNQTNAVLKSTGGAANVSAAGVSALATQLSNKAGIDDEVIQSGENVLLTFTKVRNEVGKGNDIFNQATAATLDMSVALGQDLQSSTIQVGKALNDPIKGMTALRRVGVSFTQQQQDQVKAMVASGNVLGAQKLILAELTAEFGGSAAAQATATSKLKVAFGNVAEMIGGVLLPYVDQFANWMLTKGVPLIQQKLVPAIAKLANWIANVLVPAIRDEWLPAAIRIGKVIGDKVLPILDRLGDAFVGANTSTQIATLGMAGAAKGLAPIIGKAIGQIAAKFAWMGVQALLAGAKVALAWIIAGGPISIIVAAVAAAAILIIANWDKIKRFVTAAAGAVVNFLKRNWPLIIGILLGPLGVVVALVIKHWDTIKRVFTNAVAAIIRTIVGWKNQLVGFFASAGSWLLQAGKNVIRGLANGLTAAWAVTAAWLGGRKAAVGGFFAKAITWLVEGGKNILRGLRSGFTQYWGTIVKWFKDVPGKILGILGIHSPPAWAVRAGKWILKGITKGLGLGVGSVMKFLGGLAGKFTGALKTAWGGITGALGGKPGLHGLAEPLDSLVAQLISISGGKISIISGRRSNAQQQVLYNQYLARGKRPPVVARPGTSMHERGLAADLRGPYPLMHNIARQLGLIFPVRGEPWHVQLGPGHSYYERGAWETQNEWARLHAGEMVLPARFAEVMRQEVKGGGRSGPTQNFYVSTTYDVRRIARDVGDEVAWQWKVAG